MEKFQAHLSSGQFAKLMGISKDTLFHYERLGILSPEIKAENGYRYYSMNQMDVFKVISILKELDMPLKEIKEYLNKRSPQKLIVLLEKEEALLDAKIKKLNKMKKIISEKKRITKASIEIIPTQMGYEEKHEEFLVLTEADPYTNDESIYDSMIKHEKYLNIYSIDASHTIGWMRDTKRVLANEAFHYDYLYTRVSKESNFSNFKRDKGRYLIAYHTNGYSTISETYNRMLKFANDEGLNLHGFFYEDVLLDDLSVKGYEEYIIKISVRFESSFL
ncbi:DNA-binding transcriptional regulator, MerR family [Paenibacillus algorifonticola]|uniref:DNA-binding transcriptional regulator, MerR family n=1 Tax=Paenibacillus algorifonticola TaxID=684063 RepID=A0A1I1YZG6_9BACL|nr:MerR family transcriptional regulator [Paenibacillus algorifonticola]SFE24966.1 DNA-binding transcriptional regulator, MerR family [Paenibacillus algorifonticola]